MTRAAMGEFGRRLATVDDPLTFLAGIFQRSPVAYQVYDAEGRCVLTNDAFRRLMGVEPPPGYRLLPSAGRGGQGMGDLLVQALKGDTVSSPTFWFDPREVRPDPDPAARPVAVSCTAFPLQGADEEATHVVFAFLDHTAESLYQKRLARRRDALRAIARRERETRRRLEEETRRVEASRRHLEASQRIALVGSWELDLARRDDLNANPLRWSDECFRVFGFEPGSVEVTNELFFSRVHPEDRPAIEAAVAHALATGTVYTVEHRIVLPDGTERIIHERAEIRRDPATGEPAQMVGTSQDVTAQRRLQESLAGAQRMEAVGRLAGGIAHDFNNLLTAILGFSQLAEDPGAAPAARAGYLRQVREAAERGATLTRRILAYARRDMMRAERVDLNEQIRLLAPALSRLLGAEVRLDLRLDPAPCPVRIDRGHLEQVLLNLAGNARDAMGSGGTLALTSAVEPAKEGTGPQVLLTVADTGEGMGPEILAHLFEPFFTTKGPARGTGLGLALCQGIVERHGGSIRVASTAGAGTTVSVRLPRAGDAAASRTPIPLPAPRTPPPVSTGGSAGGALILLVEDHAQVREVATGILRAGGFRVVTAVDGPSGLAAARAEGTLDAVVTDMVMPGMTGRDLAARLREERPGLPVVVCSGYADDPDLAAALRAEGIPFLAKPFTAEALVATVRGVLDRARR